jgi:hypothetical protein
MYKEACIGVFVIVAFIMAKLKANCMSTGEGIKFSITTQYNNLQQ